MEQNNNIVIAALSNYPLYKKPVGFTRGSALLFFHDLIDRLNPRLNRTRIKKRVLIATVPKSGSHFLLNIMAGFQCFFRNHMILGPYWPYDYYRSALASMPKKRIAWGHVGTQSFVQIARDFNLKIIVLVRDPRDVLLSFIDHVVTLKPHFLTSYYQSLSAEERILTTIQGTPKEIIHKSLNVVNTNFPDVNEFRTYMGFSSIGDVFRNLLEWETYEDVIFLRFEDLIGEGGGGQNDIQKEKITELCSLLQINRNMHEDKYFLEKISERKSETYSSINKGQINRWKKKGLSEGIKDVFKNNCGDVLLRLGYEEDFNW